MLLSMVPMTACGNQRENEGSSDGRPDEALSHLMRSISDGDAKSFASMCSYPIVRPYPLRTIENPETMEAYFPVIADDSLKRIMRESDTDQWEKFGWRGWALRDGTPLWYDEGVHTIPYESAAEKAFRMLLSLEEIQSLKAEYRGNWIPVATLLETDGNGIYRIDMKGNTCRLMGFDTPEDAGSDPMLLLVGSMHTEGSAETKVYTFGGNSGITAEYIPDSEPPLRLMLKKPNEKEEEITVMPGYWRDYVKTGHAHLEK